MLFRTAKGLDRIMETSVFNIGTDDKRDIAFGLKAPGTIRRCGFPVQGQCHGVGLSVHLQEEINDIISAFG